MCHVMSYKRYLLRIDTWCFFWKLPGEMPCDILLEWTLERTHGVWKVEHNLQRILFLRWFSLQHFADFHWGKFIEGNAPKNFSWYSGFLLPLVQTHANSVEDPHGFFCF